MSANEKKRFVLRIDADKLNILERWAADEFRSINGQLEYLLDKAIKDHNRMPKIKKKNDTN
jgi:hypothetical protein